MEHYQNILTIDVYQRDSGKWELIRFYGNLEYRSAELYPTLDAARAAAESGRVDWVYNN